MMRDSRDLRTTRLAKVPAPLFYFLATIVGQIGGFSFLFISRDLRWGIVLLVIISTGIAWLLRLPRSWIILNFILGPAIVSYFMLGASPTLLLIPLALAALIFLPTFWTRVPYYPTSNETYEAILSELPKDRGFTFIDLGCGFGELLVYLARNRPHGQFTGVEIGPLPYITAKFRSFFLPNLVIRASSFWSIALGDYDYVYAFLAPPPMAALWEKLQRDRPKTIIINSFPMPTNHHREIHIGDRRECVLYFYGGDKLGDQ